MNISNSNVSKSNKKTLENVKKYTDKELNDRIARAKRKSVIKFIKSLGFESEEDLKTSIFNGKSQLMKKLEEFKQNDTSGLTNQNRKLMMYEANIDPLYFEFIAYQLKNESDALIFNNKLHTFIEDHPQYVINHKYREDELHQFLFLLKKES